MGVVRLGLALELPAPRLLALYRADCQVAMVLASGLTGGKEEAKQKLLNSVSGFKRYSPGGLERWLND